MSYENLEHGKGGKVRKRRIGKNVESSLKNRFYVPRMKFIPWGLQQSYVYYPWINQGGRLQEIATTGLQGLQYTYDAVGNIMTLFDNQGDLNSQNDENLAYDYDALDRLREWQINSVVTESYSYNVTTGNLDSKGGATLYYTDTVHAATGYNDWLYAYDANGNMIERTTPEDTTYTLVYDAENRLVKVHTGNPNQPVAEYTYNGDGQMVKAVEEGRVTIYVGSYFEACIANCGGAESHTDPDCHGDEDRHRNHNSHAHLDSDGRSNIHPHTYRYDHAHPNTYRDRWSNSNPYPNCQPPLRR